MQSLICHLVEQGGSLVYIQIEMQIMSGKSKKVCHYYATKSEAHEILFHLSGLIVTFFCC